MNRKRIFTTIFVSMLVLALPGYALAESTTTSITHPIGTFTSTTQYKGRIDISNYHNIVIIVSDQVDDQVAAHNLQVVLQGQANVKIYIVPWGEVDQNKIDDVINESPDLVIIIGGNAAIPSDYYDAISGAGITVVRIAGKDQYRTQASVLMFIRSLGIQLQNYTFVKVDGTDNDTIQKELQTNNIIILIHNNRRDAELSVQDEVKNEKDMSSISQKEKAQKIIEQLEKIVNNMQNEKQKMFFQKVLEKAKEYYSEGDYTKVIVMGQIIAMEKHQEIVQRVIQKTQFRQEFMKQRAINYEHMLERMIIVAQYAGIDVSKYEEIDSNIKAEIQAGEYIEAIKDARQALFDIGLQLRLMRKHNNSHVQSIWSSIISKRGKWTITYTLPVITTRNSHEERHTRTKSNTLSESMPITTTTIPLPTVTITTTSISGSATATGSGSFSESGSITGSAGITGSATVSATITFPSPTNTSSHSRRR